MPKLLLDDAPISRIGWIAPDDIYDSVTVGKGGITKIDAVEQYLGEYAIVWLQVWANDKIIARYNARNLDSINYF